MEENRVQGVKVVGLIQGRVLVGARWGLGGGGAGSTSLIGDPRKRGLQAGSWRGSDGTEQG